MIYDRFIILVEPSVHEMKIAAVNIVDPPKQISDLHYEFVEGKLLKI